MNTFTVEFVFDCFFRGLKFLLVLFLDCLVFFSVFIIVLACVSK